MPENIKNSPELEALLKSAYSKNITVDDWNQLIGIVSSHVDYNALANALLQAQQHTNEVVNSIPLATATQQGLVRGSDAENGISILADGTMQVNSLNVNRLTQTNDTDLILDGGSADALIT